jgi:membrane protease YdiL (CAAX protease family)
VFLVFAIVIAPIVEEGFFRGILLPLCSRQWGALAGILVSSLIFALLHSHLGTFAALFSLSVGLSLAYAYTRTIAVPILLHIFFNAFNLLLVWLLTQIQML